jgi:hypothetical protein
LILGAEELYAAQTRGVGSTPATPIESDITVKLMRKSSAYTRFAKYETLARAAKAKLDSEGLDSDAPEL